MILKDEVVEGIFISETSGRFLCKVLVANKIEDCYISCSSKLNYYVKLKGKRVLLTFTKGLSVKTKYSIFAVEYYGKYILLNSSFVNKVLSEEINKTFNFKKVFTSIDLEKYVEGYKADLILNGEEQIIIEAKSIIGINRKVIYPNVSMDRALIQLEKLKELLLKNKSVYYYIVSLSPIVTQVVINDFYKDYKELLLNNIDKGMVLKGIALQYVDNEITIKRNLKIYL